ncbi:MAG TPA: ferredoxin [Candidatus Acidoferrales bacterium]|nr:ferredoxin [Candidatus Acidoferrales bacterium]
MQMRYDKKTDRLQLLVQDEKGVEPKVLDEDLTVSYTKDGRIAVISINNALSRIFDGLGVKMPSERLTDTGEAESDIRVDVDPDKCLGFGSCVIVSPDVFRLDERPGKGVFRSRAKLDVLDQTGGKDFDNLLTAAQSCPTQAISIVDRKTGKRIYPPE